MNQTHWKWFHAGRKFTNSRLLFIIFSLAAVRNTYYRFLTSKNRAGNKVFRRGFDIILSVIISAAGFLL